MKFEDLPLKYQVSAIEHHRDCIDFICDYEYISIIQMKKLIDESLAITEFTIKDDGTLVHG